MLVYKTTRCTSSDIDLVYTVPGYASNDIDLGCTSIVNCGIGLAYHIVVYTRSISLPVYSMAMYARSISMLEYPMAYFIASVSNSCVCTLLAYITILCPVKTLYASTHNCWVHQQRYKSSILSHWANILYPIYWWQKYRQTQFYGHIDLH